MIGWLILICIIWFFYYLAKQSKKNATNRKEQNNETLLRQRNREWARFIFGYKLIAKNDIEKKLIDRMLNDIRNQGLVDADEVDWLKARETSTPTKLQSTPSVALEKVLPTTGDNMSQAIHEQSKRIVVNKSERNQESNTKDWHLDNITLLLYFGAFLFVVSVGLFIALGGTSGWIRTLSVLFMALALYFSGQWIYKTKAALKPAGLTFAGIGIVITPLVGLAAHKYIGGTSPQVVWFATSILCMALYSHALVSLRKPLINYIFIFTLLSLFESGVAVINAPIYYFGWAMAAVGLLLQIISRWRDIWPDFQDASMSGSQLYIPLAAMVSLAVTPSQGFGQLGISLLLAALYYGLESYQPKRDQQRELNVLTSHVSLLSGLVSLFYGFYYDITATGIFLVALSVLHILVLLRCNKNSPIMQNIASIMLVSNLVGLVMLIKNPIAILVVLILLVMQSLFVWWQQGRTDAYVLAAFSWIALPWVFGKMVVEPTLTVNQMIIILISSFITHVTFYLVMARSRLFGSALETVRTTILINLVVVAIAIIFATAGIVILSLLATSTVLLALSWFDKDNENMWEIVSGIIISLSVARCWTDSLLLLSISVALAYNILLALRFRSEANRWISTGLWLILPIGLGGLTMPMRWSFTEYAWSYLVVMFGLIISRGFARGVFFSSDKVPLTSYMRTASVSYVFGYVVAACTAVIVSLSSQDSQLHTTAILGCVSLSVFVLAWVIEKEPQIIALQPIIWQLLLISGIRPGAMGLQITIFVLLSSILATSCYVIYRILTSNEKNDKLISKEFGLSAVFASIVAPATILYTDYLTWAMPVGLLVVGALLFDYWRYRPQSYKEISVGVMVLSFMWFLQYLGITNIQVYTHIVAFTFAGLGWWRHSVRDREVSDNYIYMALASATIPLVLQALSAVVGDIYGWWLLLEQVLFMLIGMAIGKRFVVMWGLYVAVGAVLYQLRGLGYVALAVLAIFVIGIAIYQLQKYNKPNGSDQEHSGTPEP